jgi:hypothetical protein
MIEIEMNSPYELDSFMSAEAYQEMVAKLAKS